MTGVKFLTENGILIGFSVRGHSSLNCDDMQGKIVCAAVSSAVYMAANTILEIVKDNAVAEVDEAQMLFKVNNPSKETEIVLEGFKLHIEQLAEQYSTNIKIYSEV
jgi:uncharacterized protein YsxB (DUF464 family)